MPHTIGESKTKDTDLANGRAIVTGGTLWEVWIKGAAELISHSQIERTS